jgi:hypothetical protein
LLACNPLAAVNEFALHQDKVRGGAPKGSDSQAQKRADNPADTLGLATKACTFGSVRHRSGCLMNGAGGGEMKIET